MMLIIHLLEFLFLFVIHTGLNLTISERQMTWFESFNYCKLSNKTNSQELNAGNVWLGGLFLHTPWMVHRGCFSYNGAWNASSYHKIESNITSTCSYKCRESMYFALLESRCACLKSLLNMVKINSSYCNFTCYGSEKDPCGYSTYVTIYKQEGIRRVDKSAVHNFDYEVCSLNLANSSIDNGLNKTENGETYNRRHVIKWISNDTSAEICAEIADVHYVKCLVVTESRQLVPMSCNLNYSALCESGSEREYTTTTKHMNMKTRMSTSLLKRTVFSEIYTPALLETKEAVLETTTNVKAQKTNTTKINGKTSLFSTKETNISQISTTPTSSGANSLISAKSTTRTENRETTTDIDGRNYISTNQQSISKVSITSSPGTKPLIPVNMIKVTVITVGGALITVGIAVVVILLLYKRKRKRIIYHSRNSASNDIHASLEGEQTMQMFSSNDRSRNRTNTVPFTLQQKQRPGNISVSIYQDPIDMENQYQRLDFSMRSYLKEVHDDYAMQFYKQTSTPVVNDDGLKPCKAGHTKATKDLKEVYNNYSLPYDSLSHPPEVKNDDTKLQIKTRPSVTTIDKKHNNVAYCDTAIVHEDFLYDIPKHSSKSLDN